MRKAKFWADGGQGLSRWRRGAGLGGRRRSGGGRRRCHRLQLVPGMLVLVLVLVPLGMMGMGMQRDEPA